MIWTVSDLMILLLTAALVINTAGGAAFFCAGSWSGWRLWRAERNFKGYNPLHRFRASCDGGGGDF